MAQRTPIARRFDEIIRLRIPHRKWNIARAVSEKQLLVNKQGTSTDDDEHNEEEKMAMITTPSTHRKSMSDPEELRVAAREREAGDDERKSREEEEVVEKEKEEEEEEEDGSMIGAAAAAGSPSFRDYCVGSNAFSPSRDHENDEEVSHQPKETVEGSTSDAVKSSTEQRGRRFKMVLPKQMVASIVEESFGYLDAPVERISGADVEDIVRAAKRACYRSIPMSAAPREAEKARAAKLYP
ncbi:hypothetical protein Syun_020185 [Stephania yunnanensis]|uniref:Uncharacterized protein n=1 Tax=Stephania yunnanensis TaxID=152371 RepID=A0AAP0IE24_9MAGN